MVHKVSVHIFRFQVKLHHFTVDCAGLLDLLQEEEVSFRNNQHPFPESNVPSRLETPVVGTVLENSDFVYICLAFAEPVEEVVESGLVIWLSYCILQGQNKDCNEPEVFHFELINLSEFNIEMH